MKLTYTAPYLHDKLEEGRVTYGIYLSNECPDDGFEEAIEAWLNGSKPVSIHYRFSIRGCIEFSIALSRRRNIEGTVVEKEDRPLFDALRAELLETIARLDEIRYES